MSTSIYTPYCYLIGWSKFNKYYYGVRTAKNCNPSDFFVSYFTSSKQVKKFIKQFGNPDVIQIRKTFTDKDSATKWESKVLRRLHANIRNDFLNLCNSYPDFNTSGYTIVKNLKTGEKELIKCEEFENGKNILYEHMNKGKIVSEETRIKIGESKKGEKHPFYGKHHSEETKKKMNEAKKNMSDETRKKLSESKKGENHPLYNKNHSDESKKKMSEAKKNMSDETRKKMSESRKNKIWIVNPNNEKTFIVPEKFEEYSKLGYVRGIKYK